MAKIFKLSQLDSERECENYLNWDDCDLEADSNDFPRLELSFEADQSVKPFESDLFVIIEGRYLLELLYQTFISDNPDVIKICTIPGTDFATPAASILFKYKNILVAALETEPRYAAEVAELLIPYAELAKDVVTINTKPMAEYRGDSNQTRVVGLEDITFILGINSTIKNIKKLEAPNLIMGVGAGIASWRSFQQKTVSSYIAFVRQVFIDNEGALQILNLLRDLGLNISLSKFSERKRQTHSLFI